MTNWKPMPKPKNRYPEIGTARKLKESAIEAWSVAVANKCDWWVRKFKTPARRNAPDRIFAKRNPAIGEMRVFFVEFKAADQIPSPAQLAEHENMRKLGFTVYVCDSREAFLEVFEKEDQKILTAENAVSAEKNWL